MTLLDVQNLTLETGPVDNPRRLVSALNFQIARGETVVVVGESGSGKSMTALSLVRLLPPAVRAISGTIVLDGLDVNRLSPQQMAGVRGKRIGFVFQEPQTALNPVMRVEAQIAEALQQPSSRAAQRTHIEALLAQVGIHDPARCRLQYPHELSGGMKQRVMLAIALAGEPSLLIADEPTTALDVTTQAQVLALIAAEQRRRAMSLLFITHDLAVANQIADRLLVMRHGEIVETGNRQRIFSNPQHAYTQQLLAASPRLEPQRLSVLAIAPKPLLEVRGLSVSYPVRSGLLRRTTSTIRAVASADFEIYAGETVAVVGESGSGKTTLGRGVLGLTAPVTGSVRFAGEEVLKLPPAELRMRRREFQIVFQDPYASMNPRFSVAEIIEEGMLAQRVGGDRAARAVRIERLLQQVGIDPQTKYRYPHEFSGGQRQRISIARALAVEPRLLICDEPTSSLDVSVQAQILALLRDLQSQFNLAYLFITHNLGVVAQIAHRVLVMHHGKIVEAGPTKDVLFAPRAEYTKALLRAVPRLP